MTNNKKSRDDIPPSPGKINSTPTLKLIIIDQNRVKPYDLWTKAIFSILQIQYLPISDVKERFADFNIEFIQKNYDN